MTGLDIEYFEELSHLGLIKGRVLEMGAGYGGATLKSNAQKLGLEYFATDMVAHSGVDYVADFEERSSMGVFGDNKFDACLVMNVLEHVMNPLAVLDNVVHLTAAGGAIVVVTPAMWPIHNFPVDCQRLMPDWYILYAQKRGIALHRDSFKFLGYGPVWQYRTASGYQLPMRSRRSAYHAWSRAIHKFFRTSGYGVWAAPYVLIGAVFQKAGP